jgi:hypothetical protein
MKVRLARRVSSWHGCRVFAAARGVRGSGIARRLLLSEGAAPELVRFLSLPVELAQGQSTSWVTVTRTGRFTDPRYGEFEITQQMLGQMLRNFDERVLGQDVFVDVAHRPSDGAAARIVRLEVQGDRLRALLEWTEFGAKAVRERGFAYLSAEYHENWSDNEGGPKRGCVLLGAGLTTRPVVKNLERIELAEAEHDPEDPEGALHKRAVHPRLLAHLEPSMNKHLLALKARLIALGFSESAIAGILSEASKQLAAIETDEAKCLALVESFAAVGAQAQAQIKALAAANPGSTISPSFTLQVTAPAGDSDAAKKSLADAVTAALDAQRKALAEAEGHLAGKVKLLSDTVAGDKTLSEDEKTGLVKEIAPLVTKELSDDQVRQLAAFAIQQASKRSAAVQLALLGYRGPAGSVQIRVEGDEGIKALQAQIDRRLGLTDMSEARRFDRVGGKLLDANKRFADKALAQYDAEHGARLVAEHKALAGGVGQIGDFAVPAVFERTVIREALYNLVGLNFVDVGTASMAPVIQIPYSYRDATAAGIGQTRTYELQAIPRAGVIQTFDEARPIPQKLAFRISNEMKYLLLAAPIDFDPVAENMRNITRIIGEDTDRLIQNEVVRASDEASTVNVSSEVLTAQVNGTNRVFVLAQFPIVRPRRVFDLKGAQVGSTLSPITVTLNSVARTEYVSGVTLAAGLYWIMDYNLGELRFVNELGVLQAPTNGWALTVSYTWSTNAARFNLDIGGAPDTINAVYDRLLTSIGGRKVVIENDRYYMANMLLMSGAVDNSLGQANTFTANSSRPGTGLAGDGSIATIKGIPAFNTRAPGLDTADTRIVVGERGNTRFRMVRPFSMIPVEQARDASGNFIGAEGSYGEQFIVSHTPTLRRNATTSVVLFSSAGRVARAG